MTTSELAFGDFISKLKNKKRLSNNDISFLGKVVYEYGNKQEEETLPIFMRVNFDYGKLDIDDGVILTADKVHLTLNAAFQTFSITDNGFLTIIGSSPKLGKYKVTIIEV
jgi:hypothetical protein